MIEGRKLPKLMGDTVGEKLLINKLFYNPLQILVSVEGFEPSTFGL